MTTVRDIITLALRQARVVGIGRTPRAAEADEGLVAMQSLFDSMFSGGMFGPLADVYATADYTAQENERITADGATITIPDTVEVYGEDNRTPIDLSAVVVITNSVAQNYVYSLGVWEACHALTLDSTAPLASRDKTGLAALVAMEYAEMFGSQLPPATAQRAMRFKGSISRKFSTARDAVEYY